jgi:dTDP-4-amino-4,6-dideoxygalactose transaminase
MTTLGVAAAAPSRPPAEVAPQWRVPLSDLVVDDEIASAVEDAVRSGWWSMGPRVEAFERAFAEFCGCEHAFAVANGTAALHLALVAAGIREGDEVLLPSLTFVAGANSVRHARATPVFCDIVGADDLTISPIDVERSIGPATRAVMVMHYGGHPCRMDEILEIARRHEIVVIEDSAHAPGATRYGRVCGTFGSIGCFSFFSNKNLPTGEGGMVVTDDDVLADRLRLLRSHGMTTLTWERHRGHAHAYDVVAEGFNYRLDEIRAAIGLVQLRRVRAETESRARIVDRYRRALHGVNGLTMPFSEAGDAVPAHHLAVVLLPSGMPRAAVRDRLTRAGIQTSVHYPPIHTFTHYAGCTPHRPLPNTAAVTERLLTLPLFPHMSYDDVSAVTSALLAAL